MVSKIPLIGSEQEQGFDYEYWYKQCLIDLNKEYPEPETLLSIGHHEEAGIQKKNPTFTKGEMSTLAAKSKTKKTYFKSVLAASFIGGNISNYFPHIITHRKKDVQIIDVDTEQGPYYAANAMKRVEKMCGVKYPNYYPFGIKQMHNNEDRFKLVEGFLTDPKHSGKVSILLLDGVADICTDPNDRNESEKVIHLLQRFTQSGVHVINVIHKNVTSDKLKGHLGSMLVEKCETVIELVNTNKRKKNAPIQVINRDSRGPSFDDFHFKLNEFGIPYCNDYENSSI